MVESKICADARSSASAYSKPTVAVLGSHSALDVCQGAKAHGLPNLVVCQKGREGIYAKQYKTRKTVHGPVGCVDDVLLLEKFKDISSPAALKTLRARQSIFIPHRSFSVYVGYDLIENEFSIPIFGNRRLLRAEERNTPKNQHYLLKKAGVRVPKTYSSPDKIDTLCIIKAPEAKRSYERAFFFASNSFQYKEESEKLLRQGIISPEGLQGALIEEFVLGAPFNFNFFLSPLTGELELLGIDTRRQTNLDGWLRLPAYEQSLLDGLRVAGHLLVNNIEVGHIACTLRESLLEQVFEIGERFAKTCKAEYAPGLIGPFALQGAVSPSEKGEEISIFDVSFRVPGSPGTRFTPYSEYLFNQSVSVGSRIGMEIRAALAAKRMDEIVT